MLCRIAFQPLDPGAAPYVLTIPAIVAAAIFCGTVPASIAAIAAGIATYLLILEPSWFAQRPSHTAILDTVLFIPSCSAVLWLTHRLRSTAAGATLAEARLAEVFRQVPAAAAILQAPDGSLLLNSQRSNDILGHSPRADIAVYGGLRPDGSRLAPGAYPIIRALRSGEVVGGEHMRYQRPDGRVVDLDVHAGPVRDTNGRIVAAVGMAFDITERMAAEQRVRERENALQAALEARDVLMHEADHRIKNSLQLVASMLSIQLSKADDCATKQALGGAIARVQAIANAHLALERSTDLQMIEIDPMLSELCQRVGTLNPAVELRCAGQSDASLAADKAIPLGLITSELLTNALRHAFAPGEPGEASLTIGTDERGLRLLVADRGKGLPVGPRRQGLGSSVIAALAKQIGATLNTETAPGQGTAVTIRLDLAEPAPPVRPGPN